MSSWGRCQDALYAVLDGYEKNMQGEWEPGLLHGKLTFDEINALIEPIIEAVYPIAFDMGKRSAEREREAGK